MGKCPHKKEESVGTFLCGALQKKIKLLLLLFFVNMCFFLQLMKSSIGKTTDHIFIALRVQVFILNYNFFHRFKMPSVLFHWLK